MCSSDLFPSHDTMEEIKKEEKEKWVKVFDYHNDMSNERHSAMRNVARTEIFSRVVICPRLQ